MDAVPKRHRLVHVVKVRKADGSIETKIFTGPQAALPAKTLVSSSGTLVSHNVQRSTVPANAPLGSSAGLQGTLAGVPIQNSYVSEQLAAQVMGSEQTKRGQTVVQDSSLEDVKQPSRPEPKNYDPEDDDEQQNTLEDKDDGDIDIPQQLPNEEKGNDDLSKLRSLTGKRFPESSLTAPNLPSSIIRPKSQQPSRGKSMLAGLQRHRAMQAQFLNPIPVDVHHTDSMKLLSVSCPLHISYILLCCTLWNSWSAIM